MSWTTDGQLYDMAKAFNIPLKIYWKDQLPKKLTNGNYIINMANHDQSGTHWIYALIRGKKRLYFDSFGCLPPEQLNKAFGKNYYYSIKDVQNINSGHCGMYCISLAVWLDKVPENNILEAYQSFLDKFSSDPKKNLSILKKLMNSWGIPMNKI